ncbi:hypothetical protein SUGI_1011640 [Cryptomeria japonica]|nr:hypothetical protein SUGI_1011640 [Cryptomeria japonica]
MELHRHCGAFAVVLTMIIFASQPTETAAKLKVGKEKITNLQFYLHEFFAGQNATVVLLARASSTNTSTSFFGSVWVFDNPMTEGTEPTSKLLGRAQGLFSFSGQGNDLERLSQVIVLNFIFQSGEFNGSTLAVVTTQSSPYFTEMPIVGGTDKFRWARGYALAQVLPSNIIVDT